MVVAKMVSTVLVGLPISGRLIIIAWPNGISNFSPFAMVAATFSGSMLPEASRAALNRYQWGDRSVLGFSHFPYLAIHASCASLETAVGVVPRLIAASMSPIAK